jgi:radical SAM superfamily enzyme YgiQ (UPF0313 family)
VYYEGRIFRPPSEARSLILQVTVGCRHNACTFCSMYREKDFRVKTREEIMTAIAAAKADYPSTERIFLADGDALAVDTSLLVEILDTLYRTFPKLQRVGAYGGPKDILAKSKVDLVLLRSHGLGIVYLGIESGSAKILKEINKGVTPEEMVIAGRKVMESGLKLSCTVIIGLGGKQQSLDHARETAVLINQVNPHYLGALTLMLEREAPLTRLVTSGKFSVLSPMEALQETRFLLEHLRVTDCVFRSNHASNYLPLKGTLPQDKQQLLEQIDSILGENRRECLKPEEWRGL